MITHIYSIWIVVLLVTNYLMKRFLELKMTKKIDQKLFKKKPWSWYKFTYIFFFFFLKFFPSCIRIRIQKGKRMWIYADPDAKQ